MKPSNFLAHLCLIWLFLSISLLGGYVGEAQSQTNLPTECPFVADATTSPESYTIICSGTEPINSIRYTRSSVGDGEIVVAKGIQVTDDPNNSIPNSLVNIIHGQGGSLTFRLGGSVIQPRYRSTIVVIQSVISLRRSSSAPNITFGVTFITEKGSSIISNELSAHPGVARRAALSIGGADTVNITHGGHIELAGGGFLVNTALATSSVEGVTITTLAESSIIAKGGPAIRVFNSQGTESIPITISHAGFIEARTFFGHDGAGIVATITNTSSDKDITITTKKNSSIMLTTSQAPAIYATHEGTGDISISIEGVVENLFHSGVYAKIASNSGNSSVVVKQGGLVKTRGINPNRWSLFLESANNAWSFENAGTIQGKMKIQGSYMGLEGGRLMIYFERSDGSVLPSEITGEVTGQTIIEIVGDDFVPKIIDKHIFVKTNKGKSAKDRFVFGGENVRTYGERKRLVRGLVMYIAGFDAAPADLADTDTSLAASHFIISALGLENHFLKTIPYLTSNVWFDGMEQWSKRILLEKERGASGWANLSSSSSSRDVDDIFIAYSDDSTETFKFNYEQDIASLMGGFGVIHSDNLIYGFSMGLNHAPADYSIYQTNRKLEYTGSSFGAYASYAKKKFFINLLSKLDFGSVKASNQTNQKSFLKADSRSYGARLDVGVSLNKALHIFIGTSGNITDITKISHLYEGNPNINMVGNQNAFTYAGLRFNLSRKMKNRYILTSALLAQFGTSVINKNEMEIILAGTDKHLFTNEPIYGDDYIDIDIDISLKSVDSSLLYYLRLGNKFFDNTTKQNASFGMRYIF